MSKNAWEPLGDGLWMFRDSCNVYALQTEQGLVVVNAGTGAAADAIDQLGAGAVLAVVLTHHFRDHTDGAIRFKQLGARILGPYWERDYLIDPEQHWRERQIWNSYDNRWDRYSPIRPIPVDDWLMDYETRSLGGLTWRVLPTPGVTTGAISLIVPYKGRTLAFVGELIYAPGKVHRLAPFQYNYNDAPGAVNVYAACALVKQARPDVLLPSQGVVMDAHATSQTASVVRIEPAAALDQLRGNLRRLAEIVPGIGEQFDRTDSPQLEQILPHLYRSRVGAAETSFLVSETGKVLAIDYGYNSACYLPPGKHHLSNRRPMLHAIEALAAVTGREGIDVAIASHFHDDHVNGFAMLQRLYNTQIWAGENFADLLERPMRYDRPCLWHEPVRVARKCPLNETFEWEGIPITLRPTSGHTRFGTLIEFVVDGTRCVHTGDQTFFVGAPTGLAYGPGARQFHNHVYKNGLDLGGYRQTLEHFRRFRPELVLTGHTPPYRPDERWYQVLEEGARVWDEVHRLLMPLGDEQVHFGPESQAAKLKPYRMHLRTAEPMLFDAWVLNPLPQRASATIRLIAPPGWQSEPVRLELGPRQTGTAQLRLVPPERTVCRRLPVALDLQIDDRCFGQVTEALITIGHECF